MIWLSIIYAYISLLAAERFSITPLERYRFLAHSLPRILARVSFCFRFSLLSDIDAASTSSSFRCAFDYLLFIIIIPH